MDSRLAQAVGDWRWYFHRAHAEIGIRSSWEPLCAIAAVGGHAPPAAAVDKMHAKRLAAARRHYRIEYALMMVSAEHLRMIRLACEQDLTPVRAAFGDFGNIAHFTEEAAAGRNLARTKLTVSAWLDRLGAQIASGRKQRALFAQEVRDGTERVLGRCGRDFEACLGRIP